MRIFFFINRLLAHLCVICSVSYGILQMLDWYNPYMDFTGHGKWILYLLCLSAAFLGGLQIYGPERRKR